MKIYFWFLGTRFVTLLTELDSICKVVATLSFIQGWSNLSKVGYEDWKLFHFIQHYHSHLISSEDATHRKVVLCYLNKTKEHVQSLAMRWAPGLVNFIPAVAQYFCLAFPVALTQPGAHLLVEPCMHVWYEIRPPSREVALNIIGQSGLSDGPPQRGISNRCGLCLPDAMPIIVWPLCKRRPSIIYNLESVQGRDKKWNLGCVNAATNARQIW